MKPRRTVMHVVTLARRDRRFRRYVRRGQEITADHLAVLCLRAMKKAGHV